jgi:hypothetical protein
MMVYTLAVLLFKNSVKPIDAMECAFVRGQWRGCFYQQCHVGIVVRTMFTDRYSQGLWSVQCRTVMAIWSDTLLSSHLAIYTIICFVFCDPVIYPRTSHESLCLSNGSQWYVSLLFHDMDDENYRQGFDTDPWIL